MLPQVERPGTLEKIVTALQAVLKFLGPYETPETWQKPTLLNNWILEPALGLWEDPMPVGYKKDPFGRVWLRGFVSGGIAGSAVFQLPANYRPPHVIYLLPNMTVHPDGSVRDELGAGSVVLDCSFDTRT